MDDDIEMENAQQNQLPEMVRTEHHVAAFKNSGSACLDVFFEVWKLLFCYIMLCVPYLSVQSLHYHLSLLCWPSFHSF